MNFIKKVFGKGTALNGSKNLLDFANLPKNLKKLTPLENEINSSEPNTQLRTLIDDQLSHEDIFSKLVQKSKILSEMTTKLPEQSPEDKGKLTLFIPMDEVLFFSYLPDENMCMFDMPKFKDYDIRVELPDYKTFAFLYFRDHLEEFLNFIDQKFEPILYTTGDKLYVDRIMNLIDPNKIFRHILYQDDCHLFKDTKQNVVEYIKDINLFTNRNIKRKVLVEFSPLTFTLSPDNIIPVEQYHPDNFANPDEKDNTLKELMETLDKVQNLEDVRDYLVPTYNLRQIAINSKLI